MFVEQKKNSFRLNKAVSVHVVNANVKQSASTYP